MSTVIDLASYRATREARRLPTSDSPSRPTFVQMSPFLVMTDRQVAHRRRMLEHMRQALACRSFNRIDDAPSQKLQAEQNESPKSGLSCSGMAFATD